MKLKSSAVRKIFGTPFHPFLLALFPVLFLYAHNIEEATISSTFKPIVLVLFGVSIFLLLSNLIFRDWKKSALLVSLGALIFFSHGHIHTLIGVLKYRIWKFEFGADDTLFMVWAVLGLFSFIELFRTKLKFEKFTSFLNLISSLGMT